MRLLSTSEMLLACNRLYDGVLNLHLLCITYNLDLSKLYTKSPNRAKLRSNHPLLSAIASSFSKNARIDGSASILYSPIFSSPPDYLNDPFVETHPREL